MIDANKDKQHERDHNDSEKWNELDNNTVKYAKDIKYNNEQNDNNREIVERLKKRIEALEEISQYDFAKGRVDSVLDMQIDDLQKIVEGKD